MARVKQEVYQEESQIYHYREGTNQFRLTDEQRNNINKRLPRGFALAKLHQVPKMQQKVEEIQYVTLKREPRIASEELSKQFLAQPIINSQIPTKQLGRNEIGVDKTGLRFSQLPEGKSKQAQKIKNILQRFRKHYRYPALAQHLLKIGFMNAFLQIQAQNKKNIHTIDSFKDRMMFVFKQTKKVTYEEITINLINELVDEFLFHVEQARKLEFENNLINIQKSIDKVTREISEIKQAGNYYYKKRKRNEKNYDEKQLLHISDLIRQLPKKEFVGVLQIVQEKPFIQINEESISFNLTHLKPKKIRELQFYVKKKLFNHFKSRERKKEKLKMKKKEKALLLQGLQEKSHHSNENANLIKEQCNENKKVQVKVQNEQNQGRKDIYQLEQNENKDSKSLLFESKNERQQNQQEDEEDYYLGGVEISAKNIPALQKSQKINDEDNIEFQQFNPMQKVLPYQLQEEIQDFDLDNEQSDSSMITDEQDSEY